MSAVDCLAIVRRTVTCANKTEGSRGTVASIGEADASRYEEQIIRLNATILARAVGGRAYNKHIVVDIAAVLHIDRVTAGLVQTPRVLYCDGNAAID